MLHQNRRATGRSINMFDFVLKVNLDHFRVTTGLLTTLSKKKICVMRILSLFTVFDKLTLISCGLDYFGMLWDIF